MERLIGERAAEPAREPVRSVIERLFRRLLPRLVRWAHGQLPQHARRRYDTWDLVQDACSAALTNLPDLEERDPAQVDFYLRRCILNRIRDEVRRSRIGETEWSEGLTLADGQPTPLDETLTLDARRRFRSALLALPEADQLLVVGRVELGLSYEDLARATGRASAEGSRRAARRAMFHLAREVGRIELREREARLALNRRPPGAPAPHG